MKGSATPSDWQRVEDGSALRALTDPQTRRYLEPFLRGERTVRSVALELDLSPNAVLMRVRRFLRLGLLTVTREEPRAGRAIKHYRSSAQGFFIPYAATAFETPEAWLEHEFRARDRRLLAALIRAGLAWGERQAQPEFGKRLYVVPDGRLRADFGFSPLEGAELLRPEAPALVQSYADLNLSFAAAKALQTELEALIGRYALASQESGTGSQHGDGYGLRVTLTPL